MEIIFFILEYNLILKYYLCILLFFNTLILLNFILRISNTKILINNNCNDLNSLNNSDNNIDLKYCLMFKKLIKITKNPIIFEYQLEHIKNPNKDLYKYNKYKKVISNISDISNKKFTQTKKYYKNLKKILLKKKYNKKNINNILIKLICINF